MSYPVRDDEYFPSPSSLFYALVRRSGRPRSVRREGQTDTEYYLQELAAGTPDHLARAFAGLPPADPPPPSVED